MTGYSMRYFNKTSNFTTKKKKKPRIKRGKMKSKAIYVIIYNYKL